MSLVTIERMPVFPTKLALNVLVLAVAVAFHLAASPATTTPDPAALRTLVDAAVKPVMSAHQVPGLAAAVTIDGRAYFFNYGVASRAPDRPVSETTLFELGSVSKTFTATLGLYAQALGKLSLADHPSRFMPELAGRAIDRASLLELGTYTAGGLPLQVPDEVASAAQLVPYLQGFVPAAPPGARRLYSNVSIGLFGHLTALALQREFADALETELLPRLGLAHTFVRVPAGAMPDYAWGHDAKGQPRRVSPGVFDAEAYGVKSTAADMIRFVQLNIDASALDAPVRRAVEGTQVGYYAVGGMVQGLGWEQYPYPVPLPRLLQGNSGKLLYESNPATRVTATPPAGPRLFNKTGSTGGFGAYVAFVPARRIGVVLLANRSSHRRARAHRCGHPRRARGRRREVRARQAAARRFTQASTASLPPINSPLTNSCGTVLALAMAPSARVRMWCGSGTSA
jgi:beta-lactamase class C